MKDVKSNGKYRAVTSASTEESMAQDVRAALRRCEELYEERPINPTSFETYGSLGDLESDEEAREEYFMEHKVLPRYVKVYNFN